MLRLIPDYPKVVVRDWIINYFEDKGANMRLIKVTLNRLMYFGLISRVVYRWQYDHYTEYLCKNPDYPSRVRPVIEVDDLCPLYRRRIRQGKARPPPDAFKRVSDHTYARIKK